jgi:PAS domain S-box-containing protein
MEMAKVLIVDDDAAVLAALPQALALRLKGIVIETASSGFEALARLHASDFDAIITDIKMPVMDGVTLMQQIQAFSPAIPTLLMTGHGQRDLGIQALRAGAYAFVEKPIDRDFFIAWVERAIQLRQLSRQVARQQQQLTEQNRRLEERTRELQTERDRFHQLFESAQDVIYTLATDGTITSLNPAFERYTQWARADWIGKPFAPLIHPEDLPLALQTFQAALNGQSSERFCLRVVTKDGGYRVGEFSENPQFQGGTIVGVLGIGRDVTDSMPGTRPPSR